MIYVNTNGRQAFSQFPGGGLGCLLFAVLFVVGGYYLLQGLYYLLLWAAPALLVLALVINWRVYPDTAKNWLRTLESNPVTALLYLAFAVLVFPFFSLYMFLKALGYRKIEQIKQQFDQQQPPRQDDGFYEFEELESTPKTPFEDELDVREIPPEPEKKPKKPDNPYDTFFEG